jgi:hypothetical protein
VRLDYRVFQGVATVVPGGASEDETFGVSAEVNDPNAVHPLSYEIYQNGSRISTASSVQVYAGAGGNTLTFYSVVTDATGHSVTSDHRDVWVNFAGGCDQPPCDP